MVYVSTLPFQLDDKSVLTVNDLHRELISDQKLDLEGYKLEQKELFSQYKKDMKSIAAGQELTLKSSRSHRGRPGKKENNPSWKR